MEDNRLKDLCMLEIEKVLLANGKSLKDFHGLTFIDPSILNEYGNILLFNELNFDVDEMGRMHADCLHKLNSGQLKVYDEIITAVNGVNGGFFFVYGYGGTGKTFL